MLIKRRKLSETASLSSTQRKGEQYVKGLRYAMDMQASKGVFG